MRVMNRALGIRKINEEIRKRDIDPQIIDVYALYDDTLTYSENLNAIMKKVTTLKRNSIKNGDFRYIKRIETVSDRRKKNALLQDNIRTADNTFELDTLTKPQLNKWKRNPNRYDIKGIDAPQEQSGGLCG